MQMQPSTHSVSRVHETYVPSYQPPRLGENPSPDIVKPTSINLSSGNSQGNGVTYSFQGRSNPGESYNPILYSGAQPANFSSNNQQQQQPFASQLAASVEYDQLKKAGGRVSTNYGDDQQQNYVDHFNNKQIFNEAQVNQLIKDNNDKEELIRKLKSDLYSANYVNGQRFSVSENSQFNQAELEKLRRNNDELKQDNTSLAQIIQQKQKGLDSLNNELSAKNKENEENRLQAANLETKLKQSIAESERLRGLVDTSKSINNENNSNFTNINSFKFQNDTLSNQLRLKDAKIDELSAQVRQLDIQLQQKEQESHHLIVQPEIENLKRQLRESQIINDKMIQEEQIRRANLLAEENARREKDHAEEQVKRGKHEQIDQLTIENINLTNQLKIMSQDSRDYAERCDNYQMKLRAQEEEKAKLQAQVKILEEEKLRQQLNQTFLKGIEDDVARLQVQLRGSEEEKARLIQQLRVSDDEKFRLQGEIRKIEDEKFKISSQVKALEEDKQTLQNKFKPGEDERARLQILLKLTEEDKVRLTNQLKTLQDEKIQLQLYPKGSDEDISRLKVQLKNAEEQASNLNLKVFGLEQDKSRLQSTVNGLEDEKSRLNSLLRLAEDERNRLQLESGKNKGLTSETELNSKILDLSKQLQAKDNELLRFNGFEPRYIELQAQNKDLIQKVNNLQATNNSLQSHSRKASTVVVNEYLSSPNIHANTALPSQTTDGAHWKRQYDNMHTRSIQLCEQLEEIQRLVYLKQTQIIGLENQLGLMQQDIDNQVKLNEELQKQKAIVSPAEIAALNSEIANLNSQIVNLRSENVRLKAELDNLKDQSKEVVVLRSELSELKLKALNSPNQSDIQGLEAQISRLQLANQQKEEELNLARSQNRLSTPNNHGFILELQEKEHEVQDLKVRLAQYADKNAELQTQLTLMYNKNQNLFNDEESLSLSQSTNKDQIILRYRKENKRLDQELQELKNQERISLRENYGAANRQRGCNYGC